MAKRCECVVCRTQWVDKTLPTGDYGRVYSAQIKMDNPGDVSYAIHDGINWNWYLEYRLSGQDIEIYRHWRIHKGDTGHPSTRTEFMIIENAMDKFGNIDFDNPDHVKRIATKVVLNNDYDNPYTVLNPKYVFDYEPPKYL